MQIKPAVQVFRETLDAKVCENSHGAAAVLYSQTGKVTQMFPDSARHVAFLRSSAKPFQAVPLLQHPLSKSLSLKEWAIICASHAASDEQLALVHQVLTKAEASQADLQCGPQTPLDCAIDNNCSGKHAGMLLACHYYGWPKANYLDPTHPLQQAILNCIQTQAETTAIEIGVDGCGAPVFALPMANSAKLFSRLVCNPQFSVLVEAMTQYPAIIGDDARIDSQLMQVSKGKIVAKVGADGFLGLANRETGEGMALKMHDGNNDIRGRLAIALLEANSWLTPQQAEILWQQEAFSKARVNTQGKIVGHYEFQL